MTFLILLIAIYFAPAIIAGCNGKRNWFAIFVLNLLVGWTFIGWIVALVWACMVESRLERG